MSKTYKFVVVAEDKQAVEIAFYNRKEPVTATEMFDMFHSFCLACGIPEATFRDQAYHIGIQSQTPPPAGTAKPMMGMKAPDNTDQV